MDSTPRTPADHEPAPGRAERLDGGFHRFWAAGTLANLGDGMLSTALPLIAATLTHDPLGVAGLMVARFLPWLLVAPFTGVLLDRVDRLRAMAVSNAVAASAVAVLAVLTATGDATLWVLYTVLFAVMCCETVTDPASRISVVRLVPGRLLDRANSRLEGGRLVAQDCVARPVAGLLFAVAAVLPVAGVALSYALCAVLVLIVVLMLRRSTAGGGQGHEPDSGAHSDSGKAGTAAAETGSGAVRSLVEGFRYVFGHSLLRRIALNNAGLMIGMQMGGAVLVLHVQDSLGVPAAFFGLFLSAGAVGGILGSLLTARLIGWLGRAAVMIGGSVGMGVCLALMALVPGAYLGAAVWGGLGLCMAASNIAGSLLFQVVVPDHLRGRASAAFRTVGWGLAPIGAVLGGLLGRIDLALPFLVGGLFMVAVVALLRGAIAECARLSDRAAAEQASATR